MDEVRLLDVPFSEKDQAKALGARWNPKLKKWYVPQHLSEDDFKKWLPVGPGDVDTIAHAPIYIVESDSDCWRCPQYTKVIALASDSVDDLGPCELVTYSNVKYLPPDILNYIKSNYSFFFKDFSKTVGAYYYMNHCRCGANLGDFFMHNEPGGAFSPTTEEHASHMTMIEIISTGQIEISGTFGMSCPDFISEYARRKSHLLS